MSGFHTGRAIGISQALDTVGDGSGTKNAIGDYTVPETFQLKPAVGSTYELARVIVSITDAGALNTETYGALPTLTNGIDMYIEDSEGIRYYLTDVDFPVKTNSGWADVMYDQTYETLAGGDKHIVHRLSFPRIFGDMIELDGDKGDALVVAISDNLVGLVGHRFHAQGHVIRGALNGSLS